MLLPWEVSWIQPVMTLSLPTSAKPASGLLPRDYCSSFPIGLTLYSCPLSWISVVLFPPNSQVILYNISQIIKLCSLKLFSGLQGLIHMVLLSFANNLPCLLASYTFFSLCKNMADPIILFSSPTTLSVPTWLYYVFHGTHFYLMFY